MILVAVDGVEDRSVATKAARVKTCADVHVDTGIEQRASTVDRIVFCAEMQGGDLLQGSKCTRQRVAAV